MVFCTNSAKTGMNKTCSVDYSRPIWRMQS